MRTPLVGLVAAVHSPFTAEGALNLPCVERQASHLLAHGIRHVFVGGTTGEGSSLSVEERQALARRWVEVARGTDLAVIVHVGSTSLADARALAAHAQEHGAAAIAAVAPSYFRPASLSLLVDSMAQIASGAPRLPFYYYEIPSMTGLALAPSAFVERAASRIPTLAGVKFTSHDLVEYQRCRATGIDVPFGYDEMLLAALAVGAVGAVGSTYNFAAPVSHRLLDAFGRGDLEAARAEQLRTVRLVEVLAARGYMGAAKATMMLVGVDVGPARLPNGSLSVQDTQALAAELERIGFFEWIRPTR